mgnify:CR=1 FL=1
MPGGLFDAIVGFLFGAGGAAVLNWLLRRRESDAFQALIGTVQTNRLHRATPFTGEFQALIGTVQTWAWVRLDGAIGASFKPS